MKKRPRQVDVARYAGVSPATVSLVLNGRTGGNVRISEGTRRRVQEAIRDLGYVADPVARRLAGGQNRLLGVHTFEAIFPIQKQDFYYPFLVGIEQEASNLGYDLLLFTSTGEPDGRRAVYRDGINRLWLAGGSVLLGLEKGKVELVRLLQEDYPFVFVGRREVPGIDLAYVGADYTRATRDIVCRLFALGHRRVAYLGMDVDNESARDRYAGYRQAHDDERVEPLPDLVHRLHPCALKRDLVNYLIAQGATAVVVEHDHFAAQVSCIAAESDWSIPADFSMAMLGDPLSGAHLHADVTRFTIPRREMGAQAVRLLVDMLDNGPAPRQQLTLPCAFVEGSTVGPPTVHR